MIAVFSRLSLLNQISRSCKTAGRVTVVYISLLFRQATEDSKRNGSKAGFALLIATHSSHRYLNATEHNGPYRMELHVIRDVPLGQACSTSVFVER
jgi:hypothetical protein